MTLALATGITAWAPPDFWTDDATLATVLQELDDRAEGRN